LSASLNRKNLGVSLAEGQSLAVRDGVAAQQHHRHQHRQLDNNSTVERRSPSPGEEVLCGSCDHHREHTQTGKPRKSCPDAIEPSRPVTRNEQYSQRDEAAQPGSHGHQVRAMVAAATTT
jgi:hypothetical protein